jgi:Bacterial regulatory proteins, luxR family
VREHVAAGKLNKQIARDLGITEATIKMHRARAVAKMKVQSIAELARLVERCGDQRTDSLKSAGQSRSTRRIRRYLPSLLIPMLSVAAVSDCRFFSVAALSERRSSRAFGGRRTAATVYALFSGARPPLQARFVKFESEYLAKIRPVFPAFH